MLAALLPESSVGMSEARRVYAKDPDPEAPPAPWLSFHITFSCIRKTRCYVRHMQSLETVVLAGGGAGSSLSAATPVSLRFLEDQITTLCAHLGAAEHRLLTLIAEFDAREGWAGIGIASCAHWLAWKCGISLVTARDRVRVAGALRSLPEISGAMSRGELSYSKVRALIRVATPANEAALVRLARQGTAVHVEEIVRRYRRVRRLDEATQAAAEAQRDRELRYHWDDDGLLVLHARLPAEQGALVLQALEVAADTLRLAARGDDRDDSAESSRLIPVPGPHGTDQPFAARRADALVLMAETLLQHGAAAASPGERHQIVVHVGASVLADPTRDGRAELEDGPPLAVETVRRLLCDGSIVPMTDDIDGNPLNVGRKTRAIPPALRRALASRDRGCRFPGCSHHRFTDGHHIHHWADGGETKLDNLVLLCRTHHRLVHEEGFTVGRGPAGTLVFSTPDGGRIEDAPKHVLLAADPVLALVEANATLAIGSRTIVPEWLGEKPDYDWITDALWRRDERARHTNADPTSADLA